MIVSMIQGSYFFLVMITAFLCHYYWFSGEGSGWLLLSALILTLVNVGFTFVQRIATLFFTGLAMLMAILVAYLLLPYFLLLALYLAGMTIGCRLMIDRYPTYFLPILLVNVSLIFVLIDYSHPAPLFSVMFYLAFGMMIAILFQAIFYFNFSYHEHHFYVKKAIHALIQLNDSIFSCFLAPHYQESFYFFERRLHIQKLHFIKALTSLRQVKKEIQKKNTVDATELNGVILKLSLFFSTLLDCAQLRKRIKDPHIFSTCEGELYAIAIHINKNLKQMQAAYGAKQSSLDPDVVMALGEKIKELEDIYVHVLRVILREPVVFLLFISSLKALHEEMARWPISVQ